MNRATMGLPAIVPTFLVLCSSVFAQGVKVTIRSDQPSQLASLVEAWRMAPDTRFGWTVDMTVGVLACDLGYLLQTTSLELAGETKRLWRALSTVALARQGAPDEALGLIAVVQSLLSGQVQLAGSLANRPELLVSVEREFRAVRAGEREVPIFVRSWDPMSAGIDWGLWRPDGVFRTGDLRGFFMASIYARHIRFDAQDAGPEYLLGIMRQHGGVRDAVVRLRQLHERQEVVVGPPVVPFLDLETGRGSLDAWIEAKERAEEVVVAASLDAEHDRERSEERPSPRAASKHLLDCCRDGDDLRSSYLRVLGHAVAEVVDQDEMRARRILGAGYAALREADALSTARGPVTAQRPPVQCIWVEPHPATLAGVRSFYEALRRIGLEWSDPKMAEAADDRIDLVDALLRCAGTRDVADGDGRAIANTLMHACYGVGAMGDPVQVRGARLLFEGFLGAEVEVPGDASPIRCSTATLAVSVARGQ